MSKKAWYLVLLCHLFLFDVTFSMRIVMLDPDSYKPETTGAPTTNATIKQTSLPATTQLPTTDVIQDGKHENPEVSMSERESLEKPLPKKRGILDALYQPGNFDETGYDANEDTVQDESFSASKSDFEEKPFYKYGDAAFVADDGYFENEGRTKRRVNLDDLYNKQQGHTIELTPDDVMALLAFLQSRVHKDELANPWPYDDNTVGSIEADMRDEDVYKYRNEKEKGYESYPSDVGRFPSSRIRRNSVYEHQRPNTPTYRRLIL